MAKLEGVNWADAGAIGSLRIGDFACGTGALLSAVYEQVAARHQRTGGNLAALHPVMMEEVGHPYDEGNTNFAVHNYVDECHHALGVI